MNMEEIARRLRALDIPTTVHTVPYAEEYGWYKRSPQKLKYKLIIDAPNGQSLVFVNYDEPYLDVNQLTVFGLALASLGGTDDTLHVPYNTKTGTDRDKYLKGRRLR
jgi:hypothetical protein